MGRWIRHLLLGFCLVLAAGRLAAVSKLVDWIEPGEARYQMLRQAAQAAGSQGWLASRLKDQDRVPQASARLLVAELMDSPKLDDTLKARLRQAFPSEVDEMAKPDPEIPKQTEELKKLLDSLQPRIDDLIERKGKNNYSPLSTPQARLTFSNFLSDSEFHGLVNQESVSVGPYQYEAAVGLHISGRVANVGYDMDLLKFIPAPSESLYFMNPVYGSWSTNTNPGNVNYSSTFNNFWTLGSQANVTFDINPAWFTNAKLAMGTSSVALDPLIFSGTKQPDPQPFYQATVIKHDYVEPSADAKGFNGFYLQKNGPTGWWVFTTTQLLVAPAWDKPDPNSIDPGSSVQGQNLLAGRVDMRGFDLWLLEDINFWASSVLTTSDFTDAPHSGRYLSDRDFSVGLQGQVWGGGLFTCTDWRDG